MQQTLASRLEQEDLKSNGGGTSYFDLIRRCPSVAMTRIANLIDKVAASAKIDSIIIFGETGMGKEFVVKAIHEMSARRRQPLVEINAGNFNLDMMGTELFGHEKGAFTSATTDRKGCFEMADRGTLFLDEIGELPLPVQARMLRILQSEVGQTLTTRRFRRVGGQQEITCDVRVVCATHQDLAQMVKEGRFRADLYHRLNLFPITVPPLSKRPEDVAYFIKYYLREFFNDDVVISDDAWGMLLMNPWPGNVRQIRNLFNRLATEFEGVKVLEPSHFEGVVDTESVGMSLDQIADQLVAILCANVEGCSLSNLLDLELSKLVYKKLAASGRTFGEISTMLGIDQATLYRKRRGLWHTE